MGDYLQAPVFPFKKAFLYTLVISVIACAALGVFSILTGNYGWFNGQVMLTAGAISLASIVGLACGAYLGTGRAPARGLLPVAGIVLTAAALTVFLVGVWLSDFLRDERLLPLYARLFPSLSIFAIACAHLSLLSMARLANWFKWSLVVAHVVIFAVATFLVGLIWFGLPDSVAPFYLLAIAAIIDAAISLLIPLFHKLSSVDAEIVQRNQSDQHAKIDEEIAMLQARIALLENMKQAQH